MMIYTVQYEHEFGINLRPCRSKEIAKREAFQTMKFNLDDFRERLLPGLAGFVTLLGLIRAIRKNEFEAAANIWHGVLEESFNIIEAPLIEE